MINDANFSVVGESIRARRKELNMTQTELANALGTSQGYIADVENGNIKTPSADRLNKIADILSINMSRLLAESKEGEIILTPMEEDLIELFRELPEDEKLKYRYRLEGKVEALREQIKKRPG